MARGRVPFPTFSWNKKRAKTLFHKKVKNVGQCSQNAVWGLKIWQKLFQIKCFHIANTKFDFVWGQILHAYQARPFIIIYSWNKNRLTKMTISKNIWLIVCNVRVHWNNFEIRWSWPKNLIFNRDQWSAGKKFIFLFVNLIIISIEFTIF